MSTERIQASGTMLQNSSWFVLGGINYDEKELATSEILLDGLFVPSLNWPESVYGHCMSQFNRSHIFIAGGEGQRGSLLGSAYILNVETKFWLSTEETMKYPRKGHACGFAVDNTNEWHSIVAGGFNNLFVELLSLTTLKWTLGPRLPFEMDWASGVQIIDSFHIIGGEHIGYCSKRHLCYSSNSIFKLNLELRSWEIQNQTMKFPRSKHISIKLPTTLDLCQPICKECKGI